MFYLVHSFITPIFASTINNNNPLTPAATGNSGTKTMKTSRVYTATYSGNGDFVGTFDWQNIMNEAKDYQFVVMYRNHERGNGKGEYFSASAFAELFSNQNYWFINEERPVHTVILTDDDVPGIIAHRRELIDKIQRIELDIHLHRVPARPDCDGRATRRTQPEAFAAWDKARAKAERKRKALHNTRESLFEALSAVNPYYSTTLYNIK